MDIKHYISNGFLKIYVKTGMPKTEVTGYDESRQAVKVNVHAPPVEGKANVEVIKYFSRLLKRKIEIKSGKTSKEKLLKII